jgi:tripartite-type tricarboxylate transporter receptor subunit TctC
MLTGKPLIEAGKLRALAVSGPKRVAAMQDVPTVAEAGVPGYSALQWYGLLAPAGTPQPVIDKLAAAVAEALRAPEVRERLAQDSAEPVGSAPAEFSALVKSELVKWADIARAAHIQAE